MTTILLPLQRPANAVANHAAVHRPRLHARAHLSAQSSLGRPFSVMGGCRGTPRPRLVAVRAAEGGDAGASPQSTAGAQAVANQDVLIDQLLAASSDEEFLRIVTEKCVQL